MKNKFIWLALCILIPATMILASCSSSSTTTTAAATTTTSSAAITTTTAAVVNTNTTTTTATAAVTTTTTGNWWDSLGTPQYGGTITIASNSNVVNFDTYNGTTNNSLNMAWDEQTFTDDWTLNPAVYNYQISFRPPDYAAGDLAASWEFSPTDINTFIIAIRQNVYFQNLAPVNGRQLTAADVAYTYDRNFGLGNGFTTVSPSWASAPQIAIKAVTLIDKFTVSFTWAGTNPESIAENMQQASIVNCIIPSELVTTYGNTNNWHNQVGSGPFILTDWVDSSSMWLTANPNYWGYDERFPQNHLPYVNSINVLIIPNTSTALAAMRTGKIDFDNSGLTPTVVTSLQKTNPEINVIKVDAAVLDILPKSSAAPFNNLNVRIAAQEALNLPLIASSYYMGTANPMPQTLVSYYITGWGWPYPQWPASLQAEYSYNPTNARALLSAAGYPNGFNTTLYVDQTNDMDLLNIVQSEEAAVGINITLSLMSSAAISAYLATPQWSTGLAQRTTGLIGRIMAPLRVLPEFIPGNSVNFEGWNDPVYTAIYNNAMAATNIDTIKGYVQQACQYVTQHHILICLDTPTGYCLCQPWIVGYSGQNYAFSNLIQTYGARMWVNQAVKNSY
ncbi:MAG: ABC transporter substrate-binding protein [Dehalococcoidales bacterium]